MSEAMALRDTVGQMAPDPALPQLAHLLDPDAVAPVLARSLGRDVASVRIAYVSYSPAERVGVQYEVTADGETHHAVGLADAGSDLAAWAHAPEHLELAAKAGIRTPARETLAYESDLDVLVHWLPLDLALPALVEPPDRLRELLEDAGLETGQTEQLRLVGYKPRRRAVFRLERHFVKMYGKESLFARSVGNLRAAASLPLRTARLEAEIPELRIEVQSLLEGDQPSDPATVAAEAGRILTTLHASRLDGLREAPPAYWLKNVRGSVRVLAAVVPSLGQRLESVSEALSDGVQDARLVPCHVDFFARQLIGSDGDYGVVDFDRMSFAAPALDLATYVSELVEDADLSRAATVLDELCDAYGGRPRGIHWYLAVVLLRRARTPFGHLLPDWPSEVERRVSAAEAALEL